jgi:hypothetical protein
MTEKEAEDEIKPVQHITDFVIAPSALVSLKATHEHQ